MIEVGGGETPVITHFSGTMTAIPVGSSDTLISIPLPPQGQRVKLNSLSTTSGSQALITVESGGDVIVQSKTLTTNTTSGVGEFNVGRGSNGTLTGYTGTIPEINSRVNRTIEVKLDSSTTGVEITYSYSYFK